MNCYLGIDIGTSGCKAVVFDEAGQQVSSAYREYDVLSPEPGWAELDSEQVIEKCFEVIGQAAGDAPEGSIRGLGVSSQGEAFTPIDKDGRCLANAMVSFDTRAADYARKWPEEFGSEKLYRITGQTAHPMYSLFKLLWLRDNRAEIFSKAQKFLCFEDLLGFRLGLPPAMGWSLAGRTMFFDVNKHQWSGEILDAVGLSADKLAVPLRSGTIAGIIKSQIARELGLGEEVFVVTAGHDQTCGALGAGVTEPGVAMYATGTVECITPAFPQAVFSEELRKNNLCTYDHTVAGMYATVAFSLTGGNILKWFRDEFGAQELAEAERTGVNAYELLLKAAGDKPSGLLVLPYFTPSGTPYFDTQTKGAILGLRLSTTRSELIRALLEGVAFEMRLNLQILARSGCEVRQLRAIGGGAKSGIWTQLKADVIGKPITMLKVTEAGCMGVAMLARAAEAGEPLKKLAEEWIEISDVKEPRTEWANWYQSQFERYKQLYLTLRELN